MILPFHLITYSLIYLFTLFENIFILLFVSFQMGMGMGGQAGFDAG